MPEELPLHEQLRNHQWRQMIETAGPGDTDNLKRIALAILDYSVTSRLFALQAAAAGLPRQQKAPTA
jgi:hypothetical protein